MASSRSSRLFIAPAALRSSYAKVEVQEHEDAGLRVEAEQSDQADPDADGDVVAERVKEPHAPTAEKGTASRTSSVFGKDFVFA